MKRLRAGFTLVELLVVIGIIAVLISILLPVLAASREQARTIKCASNLRSIGQAIAQYVASNHGFLPASNYYYGIVMTANNTYTPAQGYVHWSSLIYEQNYAQGDGHYLTPNGWEMFQCPSLENGGLPPANTYAANSEGLANEAGAGVIDLQAPRLSYMLNEALTPRSVLALNVRGNPAYYYHWVSPTVVSNSSNVILATEEWGIQAIMEASSNMGGSAPVSNSRRPVSGISKSLTTAAGGVITKADAPYTLQQGGMFGWATVDCMKPDPSTYYLSVGGIPNPDTTLDFIGRNHGKQTYGGVGGSTQSGWDLRKSNFLYLDGHVETKHVAETVYPKTQWGERFYDLETPN
jgi:prepilin-type N-terminal cleavage/methylation domain-containing protein/prepilin-type processing-associated H-X9-DG protein